MLLLTTTRKMACHFQVKNASPFDTVTKNVELFVYTKFHRYFYLAFDSRAFYEETFFYNNVIISYSFVETLCFVTVQIIEHVIHGKRI